MKRYGIIGLGRVGSLVAARLTERGHEVSWVDPAVNSSAGSDEGTDGRTAGIDLQRIGEQSTIGHLRTCDVVLECVTENRRAKVSVLKELQGTSAAVLTTTSSFTVADLAHAAGLGGRLAGFHFLPSYGGELVEITSDTSDSDVGVRATELASELGLGWLEVADKPGRISRRLLVPFLQNVLRAVDLKIASAKDIDKVVELGLGHAVGPLRRLAHAGLNDHRAAAELLLTTSSTGTAETATPKEGNR
jgi:3-hydroxybutyryl-CoA dehydrogenase